MGSSTGIERRSAWSLLRALHPMAFLQGDIMTRGDGCRSRAVASTTTGSSVADGVARQSDVGARK
jgi:hypothetical protein